MSPKPLGRKNYGSIPHLSGSRLGPRDYTCNPGQEQILLHRVRDAQDRIIVQEKLDGSNVGIARLQGQIIPLVRSGHRAESSPYEQHHWFARWVHRDWERWLALLAEGESLCGEWLAQAHGTRYDLRDREPLVVFDLRTAQGDRYLYQDLCDRLGSSVATAPLLACRDGAAVPLTLALEQLGEYGHYNAQEPVEGVVYRCERQGRVEFLAKYVYPGKQDGKYLPEVSGAAPVWNWRPETVSL